MDLETCFSGQALVLLGTIGGVIQTVVVALFWLGIRSKDDAIKDARAQRDRALDINEQMIPPLERQARVADRVTRGTRGRGGGPS